jgi:hypothetical protein
MLVDFLPPRQLSDIAPRYDDMLVMLRPVATVNPASISQRHAAFHGAYLEIDHPLAVAVPFTIAV